MMFLAVKHLSLIFRKREVSILPHTSLFPACDLSKGVVQTVKIIEEKEVLS